MVLFRSLMAWSMRWRACLRVFFQQQAGMLEGQPDRVDRLDDAVVQVHADALALFQHGQAALLQVEAHVLDRRADPGADGGQELDLQLVEELRLAGGHAQHPQHPAAPGQREAGHLVEAVVSTAQV